ncbi:Thioredoxin-disulfide reductase protein [Dioscorea alata]|uniref:Thioredoxin-disulfide reductase protein n=1 Tax=Dioscorea alata TaxID=55571 RepID=A0ACB7WFL8_DIOAL|nr:Thioredoxin-disulfide reductase protein [Dioscorea alata]
MARSLSGVMLKNILRSAAPSFNFKSSGAVLYRGLDYTTRISGDSDTHEDFRPTDNLQSSGTSLIDLVQQDVKENPVMIYMKGHPDAPRCGFSALAVKVLQQYGVPITSRNILEGSEIKDAVKSFTNWPTFPQIFIKGEFIGGSDIALKMHQDGELKLLLQDIVDNKGKE